MRAFTDKEVLDRVAGLSTFNGFPNGVMDVWIRSTADQFDSFDDKAFTYECFGNTKTPKFIMARNGTTMYDSHAYGAHHGKPAYREVKGFPYFRDPNKNHRAEEIGNERHDVIGANIHRAGQNSTVINNWSTGCLVTANLSKFLQFLAYMKSKGNPPLTVCILKEW
jgi:hypothetical protein